MAEAFYPFVENGASEGVPEGGALQVRQGARIAVYDDPSAAPRVVVVEPSDIRSFLEEITATVTRLAQEQGGHIPFTVIREVVENLIHAYFIEPTISILDSGNTIRFSDQGPGIEDKQRALQYGTTSATSEMKRYIRGVGSGLPYAQQWLEEKGGSLTVEDNIHNGTVVTVSLAHGADEAEEPQYAMTQGAAFAGQQPGALWPAQQPTNPWQQQQAYPPTWQAAPAQQPSYPANSPYQQPWGALVGAPQPYGYGQGGLPAPQQGYPAQPYQQPWPQQQPTMPPQHAMAAGVPAGAAAVDVSARGIQALEYLRTNAAVGPNDLTNVYGGSAPTWSRELKILESQGLLAKQGQKRQLTPLGRQFLGL